MEIFLIVTEKTLYSARFNDEEKSNNIADFVINNNNYSFYVHNIIIV